MSHALPVRWPRLEPAVAWLHRPVTAASEHAARAALALAAGVVVTGLAVLAAVAR